MFERIILVSEILYNSLSVCLYVILLESHNVMILTHPIRLLFLLNVNWFIWRYILEIKPILYLV